MTGTIIYYDSDLKYGYIQPDNDGSLPVYFHSTVSERISNGSSTFNRLIDSPAGRKVSFVLEVGAKEIRATAVQAVSESE